MKLVCRYVPMASRDLPFCILAVADEDAGEALHVYVCSRVDEALALAPLLTDQDERDVFQASVVHSALSLQGSPGRVEYTSSAACMIYGLLAENDPRWPFVSEQVDVPKPRLYVAPAHDLDPSMVILFFSAPDGSCVLHLVYSLTQYYAACDDPELEWKMYQHAEELVALVDFPEESSQQAYRVTGVFATFLVRALQFRIDRERAASLSVDPRVNVIANKNALLS